MVKIHLASARECIVRSACAKGGVTCGYQSSCVSGALRDSGWALLRSASATCGQPAVATMLQQLMSRHWQGQLCASCARAETRDLASDACEGLRFRAACAAVAERTRGTRAGSASAATRHADREWSQCCLQID